MTIVGAGFVGHTTAMRIAQSGCADVCMIDIIEGWPQGLALDMRHSAPIEGFSGNIVGSNDYADSSGSDVVVITAGLARKPGMSRLDLLLKNAEIVKGVCAQIVDHSPRAVVIVVTNPLDEMTHLAAQETGFDHQRVMGMAGVLDSARLVTAIGDELDVLPVVVDAMTLGSHGEQMVPLPRHATVEGKPLTDLLDGEALQRLYDQTVSAGAAIVELLGSSSAFYAPSAAVAKMVKAVLTGGSEVLPVSAWVTGQYGIKDVYVGVPAILGPKGVEKIVELDLDESELLALQKAAAAIRARCEDL